MRRHLFDHVNSLAATDALSEWSRARRGPGSARASNARSIAAGGIDLMVLGLGGNGHIGFNEPGSALVTLARIERG